ncbi:hypothetical protein SRHO_G00177310 [Serrasalmus rhombeus]
MVHCGAVLLLNEAECVVFSCVEVGEGRLLRSEVSASLQLAACCPVSMVLLLWSPRRCSCCVGIVHWS